MMNEKDRAVLKAACELFPERYPPSPPGGEAATLDGAGINLLAQKIALLPESDRALLYCRYCMGMEIDAAGRALELDCPQARLDCAQGLLSLAAGFYNQIAQGSMAEASQRAMRRELAADGVTLPKPAPQKAGSVVWLVLRRLAVAALITMLTVTTALAASPELRARVFQWMVATFPTHSIIGTVPVEVEPTQADFERLMGYWPEYIPEGYALEEKTLEFPWVLYSYSNGTDYWLSFDGYLADGFTYYDTEDATIETMTYLGQPAFYWEKEGFAYFVWQQDGFQFDIVGKITKDEVMKMAESIIFRGL